MIREIARCWLRFVAFGLGPLGTAAGAAELPPLIPPPSTAAAIIRLVPPHAGSNLLLLDGTGSSAHDFAWASDAPAGSWLPIDGGQRLVFGPASAGTYRFTLAVAAGDHVSLVEEAVSVGAGPVAKEGAVSSADPPLPAPPVPPLPPVPPAPPIVPVVLPQLSVPATVQGDVGAFVKVGATTNGSEVRWVALDAGLQVFPAELLRNSLTTVVTSSAAGQYRLLAYTALADLPSDPAVCLVTIGVPQPPTPPAPPTPPTPPVPPTPTAASLWLISIDDATVRTPAVGALLGNATYWAAVKNAGHHFAAIDANNPAAAQYKSCITQAGGTPCLIVVDAATKKLLAAVRLPADTAGVDALIAKFTGKISARRGATVNRLVATVGRQKR